MSKKTRGAARTRQRRPGTRPASGGRPISRPSETAASQVADDELVATGTQDPLASAVLSSSSAQVSRQSTRPGHGRPRAKPGSLLAARAATEYVYVAQDLRRISVVGIVLFGALILLWLAVVVLRLVPLPFY